MKPRWACDYENNEITRDGAPVLALYDWYYGTEEEAISALIVDANRGAAVDGLLKAIRDIDTAAWFKLTAVERSRRWEALREAISKAG